MTAIPGVTIQKNDNGKLKQLSINLEERPDIIPALEKLGLLPEPEANLENGHTVEDFMNAMEAVVSKHYANHH